jgi:hypothetical protein
VLIGIPQSSPSAVEMTIRQFSKLPAGLQAEVHKAYLALMSPSNVASLADLGLADARVIPRGHLSIDQKMAIGRWLLHHKASSLRPMAGQATRFGAVDGATVYCIGEGNAGRLLTLFG